MQSKNLGGAGGFKRGLEICRKLNVDFAIIMDDDVKFLPNALEESFFSLHDTELLQFKKLNFDNSNYLFSPVFEPSRAIVTLSQESKINTVSFEGLILPMCLLEDIGFPNEDFFITWDDTLFGFKASQASYQIRQTRNVICKRSKQQSVFKIFRRTVHKTSKLQVYYAIRNRWIVKNELMALGLLNSSKFAQGTFYIIAKECLRALLVQRSMLVFHGILLGIMDNIRRN